MKHAVKHSAHFIAHRLVPMKRHDAFGDRA